MAKQFNYLGRTSRYLSPRTYRSDPKFWENRDAQRLGQGEPRDIQVPLVLLARHAVPQRRTGDPRIKPAAAELGCGLYFLLFFLRVWRKNSSHPFGFKTDCRQLGRQREVVIEIDPLIVAWWELRRMCLPTSQRQPANSLSNK